MIQFRRPASFIEKALYDRGRRVYTLTGARMADGRVEYQLDSGGESVQFTEDEHAVLSSFWVEGVTLTSVEYTPDGWVIYTVKEK